VEMFDLSGLINRGFLHRVQFSITACSEVAARNFGILSLQQQQGRRGARPRLQTKTYTPITNPEISFMVPSATGRPFTATLPQTVPRDLRPLSTSSRQVLPAPLGPMMANTAPEGALPDTLPDVQGVAGHSRNRGKGLGAQQAG